MDDLFELLFAHLAEDPEGIVGLDAKTCKPGRFDVTAAGAILDVEVHA